MRVLDLINEAREEAGVPPLTLGQNRAAQLHAEAMLDHCFMSHWDVDGLQPTMRYSLAGGYQANSENVSGISYCYNKNERVTGNEDIYSAIQLAMDGLMGSPGHRLNILNPLYRMVNIGLTWDLSANLRVVQQFEGDYVSYDLNPNISNNSLSMAGDTRNGASLREEEDLGVSVYFDPPPHPLTAGQLSMTYCGNLGQLALSLRRPPGKGYLYLWDHYSTSDQPCTDPYDPSEVPSDTPAPRSAWQAHSRWQQAKLAPSPIRSFSVPWVTASEWTVSDGTFSVAADISDILDQYGAGVYTVVVWALVAGDMEVISQYSIFHEVTPPAAEGS